MSVDDACPSSTAVSTVLSRVRGRCTIFLRAFLPFVFFKTAFADGEEDSADEFFKNFDPATTDDKKITADAQWTTTPIDFRLFRKIGDTIRSAYCYRNLSGYLATLGGIAQADYSGSSSALTLLPTAGILVGAPARELWMLYKLVPLAGVLSMLLSFGGSIAPKRSSDYELEGYSFDGIISSTGNSKQHGETTQLPIKDMDELTFARCVKARANNPFGSSKRAKATIGISVQLTLVALVIFACWLTGLGSVLVWWCEAKSWMLAWYFGIAVTSLLENAVLVPFSKQWTIRVSQAPASLKISDNAPTIIPVRPKSQHNSNVSDWDVATPAGLEHVSASGSQNNIADEYGSYPAHLTRQRSELLHKLEKYGYNTVGQIHSDPNQPWASNCYAFMVVISVSETTRSKAILRVLSKLVSIGVFVAGTAAFASTTLVAVSVAAIDLVFIIGGAVFGRVAALWMISEMMKEKPIMHRIVQNELEADAFIREILATPGLTIELMGHVFINGKCVKRYNRFFNLSTIFGVLVPPYKIEKLLTRGAHGE
ncbi:hypothetical protein F4860DRAFT_515718 [Xylaria cubensis]|nr:hypothetical protein F4860DRAFT_515718 [Xylaria cubensis]